MPRASWRDFLRLSLVSCPIYLSPATTRTKPIRLHQVWRTALAAEADDLADQVRAQHLPDTSAPRFTDDADKGVEQTRAATRITLRPHDPSAGEEIEGEELIKGDEYQRGRFITLTAEELKALDVENSKVIDLETFIPRCELDPIYLNSAYYVYPDGPIAVETLQVISAAMAKAGVVGLGRLTLSRRERVKRQAIGTPDRH
jgi:DNA end-binding protein Ku